MIACIKLSGHGIDQAGHFHCDQQLREEALLGALKPRERRALGLGIERLVLHPVDDVGEREHFIEIAVDDGLSRGSGNAEERGVTGEFP